jgi:hypothetical protein
VLIYRHSVDVSEASISGISATGVIKNIAESLPKLQYGMYWWDDFDPKGEVYASKNPRGDDYTGNQDWPAAPKDSGLNLKGGMPMLPSTMPSNIRNIRKFVSSGRIMLNDPALQGRIAPPTPALTVAAPPLITTQVDSPPAKLTAKDIMNRLRKPGSVTSDDGQVKRLTDEIAHLKDDLATAQTERQDDINQFGIVLEAIDEKESLSDKAITTVREVRDHIGILAKLLDGEMRTANPEDGMLTLDHETTVSVQYKLQIAGATHAWYKAAMGFEENVPDRQ